ncbi:hypothetical protein ACLB2K_003466 [Fragaria x ananassa]
MCVSKEWHALIKSSYFTAVHLQRSDSNLLLLFSKTTVYEEYSIYTISLLRNESRHLSLDLPFINCSIMHWLVPAGSSSGLVCLKISDPLSQYIVIWNPATKQFRFLPDSRDDHYLLGFEFFHDTRDYKVVSILEPIDNTIRANVFTRSTNSWREVKTHNCCSSHPVYFLGTSSSITLNGVLYSPLWINDLRSHVLSFNLRDEVFHAIPLPESSIAGRIDLLSWKNSLAFLGGCEYEPSRHSRELWVMTEEPRPSAGTTQITWVKQFILEPSWSLPRGILGCWKDEYLLEDDNSNHLHCYDLASNKLKRLPHHDHTHDYSYKKAINYVESLVSVD